MNSDERTQAERLVTAVAAWGLGTTSLALPPRPLGPRAWRQLLAQVQIHRLAGLLAGHIANGDFPVTDEQREQAVSLHTGWMELSLLLEADVLLVGQILAQARVPYRLLKGAAFAHLDYPDPAMRIFGDIDILVPSQSFDQAAASLRNEGCHRRYPEMRRGFDRRFGKGANFTAPTGRDIDVHRTFVMGPFGLTIDLADVWHASSVFLLAGKPIPALQADHRFLHACYHAAVGNKTPHLVPLRDLAQMLHRREDAVDVQNVKELAQRWRAEAVVARAVRLAWDRFSLEESELSEWAGTFRPSARERQALATYLDPAMGYAARSFAAVRVLPGLNQKAAFAWAMAFPNRAYGAGRHRGRWQRWWGAAGEVARLHRAAGKM